MIHLKRFNESIETPYDKYADYFVNFIDDSRYDIKFEDKKITITIDYTKRELYNNRGRKIIGFFDKKEVHFQNNKVGPLYSYTKKSSDTLDITNKLEDSLIKVANFTEDNVGYFKIDVNVIRIYLGQESLDLYNKYY